MSFADLGLSPLVLKALHAAAYETPTAVQSAAIPAALTGADLLVSAQTGSGKTAAFMLPSLHRLATPSTGSGNGPRILVLTPTRELAQQVQKASDKYGCEIHRLRTVSVVGGVPYGLQLKQMSHPVDIMVATPGRLMDHMERGRVDFDRLEVLILDEADRMLDMGFIDDIKHIVSKTPNTRQTLLFSATLDGTVGVLARNLTRDPQRIEIGHSAENALQIEQRCIFADNHFHKTRLVDALLADETVVQAVVFVATKASADTLTDHLREQGIEASALHGDMPQTKRTRTIKSLRDGHVRVLVATDVAARGIDVPAISHVINYDLPRQAEDYVHRIGRTGRAGRAGIAISLANHGERHMLRTIERYTHQPIAITTLPGLEAKPRSERPDNGPRGDRPPRPYAPRSNYGERSNYGDRNDRQDRPPRDSRESRFAFTDRPRSDGDQPQGERRPFNREGGGFNREGGGFNRESREGGSPGGFPSRGDKPRSTGPRSANPYSDSPYAARTDTRRSGPWEGRNSGAPEARGSGAPEGRGEGQNYWKESPARSDDQPGANAWNSGNERPAKSFARKDGAPRGGDKNDR
jgi:superfamily II DNA/RNA helicase